MTLAVSCFDVFRRVANETVGKNLEKRGERRSRLMIVAEIQELPSLAMAIALTLA